MSHANGRIKVAVVLYRDDPSSGGSFRVGETIANHLAPFGVEAHLVFAYGLPGPAAQQSSVPCHFLSAKHWRDSVAWMRARRFFRSLNPQVVHFVDSVMWLQMALAGLGYKKLIHVHGKPSPAISPYWAQMSFKDRMLSKMTAKTATGQVCISEASQRAMVQLGWYRPDRIWTIQNAIDSKYYETLPSQNEARQILGLPIKPKMLGMVCRLVQNKGCQEAIGILSLLPPDWHLALFGNGPFHEELRLATHEQGLTGRVHFVGLLPDVRPAYAAIDIFLLLARYEPFGLATCEAMAAGVPVFALAGDGEYRNSESPLLTKDLCIMLERSNRERYDLPESTDVLKRFAERIHDFGRHPEHYSPMQNAARQWVRERFDAPIQAKQMAELYRKVLEFPD